MKFSFGLICYLIIEIFGSTTLFAQNPNLIRNCLLPETNEHKMIEFGVMLPPSYRNNGQLYPVVYYLHGLNGQYNGHKAKMIAEFFTNNSINGDVPECIVIFPDGGEGFWSDHYDRDPLLEKEIVEFLVPYIDQNYSIDVNKRLIMGWSAGGAGAMYFFSKHPRLFKAAISLDGSITSWEEFVKFQGERPGIVNNSDYYYESCSPNEWIVRNKNIIKEKQDTSLFLTASFFAKSHQHFLSILNEQKIPYKYKELNCNHDFECVFSEISNDLLSFLLKAID